MEYRKVPSLWKINICKITSIFCQSLCIKYELFFFFSFFFLQTGSYSKAMEKIISSGPEKNEKPASLNQSHYASSTGSVASVFQVSVKLP